MVVLSWAGGSGAIRKKPEQAMRSNSEISMPLSLLLQVLPHASWLEFFPDFSQ